LLDSPRNHLLNTPGTSIALAQDMTNDNDITLVTSCPAAIAAERTRLKGTVLGQCERELERCAARVGGLGSYARCELGEDGSWHAMGVCTDLFGQPMVFVCSRPYATRQGAEDELLMRLLRVLR